MKKRIFQDPPFHTNFFTYSSVLWDVSSPKEIDLKQTLWPVPLCKGSSALDLHFLTTTKSNTSFSPSGSASQHLTRPSCHTLYILFSILKKACENSGQKENQMKSQETPHHQEVQKPQKCSISVQSLFYEERGVIATLPSSSFGSLLQELGFPLG